MGYGPPWCGMGIALGTSMWFCEEYTNLGTEEWQQKWPRALSLPETSPNPRCRIWCLRTLRCWARLGWRTGSPQGVHSCQRTQQVWLLPGSLGLLTSREQQVRRGLTVTAGESVLIRRREGAAETRGDRLCNTHVTQVTPRGASCCSLPHCHCECIDTASLNECQGLRPFQSR